MGTRLRLITCPCTCYPGEIFANELSTPEFFTDNKQALDCFKMRKEINDKAQLDLRREGKGLCRFQELANLRRLVQETVYWAVHINGQHITNYVKD